MKGLFPSACAQKLAVHGRNGCRVARQATWLMPG
ncbi:MAG: hypothetical protein AB3N11_04990 [Arenibacterium sp.]